MTDRPSLRATELAPFWDQVRDRLERRGTEKPGRLRVPALPSSARHTLAALMGRPIGVTVDLAALEGALRQLGVGDDLVTALGELGHPVSADPARQRAERRAASDARAAARTAAAEWPEPWREMWADEMIRAGCLRGLDTPAAVALVASVRAVLDRLDGVRTSPDVAPLSRVDLAAELLGSSHALDAGTRLEAAVTRALAHQLGSAEPRAVWEQAGVHLDLTSAPALTWALPVVPSGPGLGALVVSAVQLGVPLHLSQLALREHPVVVEAGVDVLVVENPRVVEAAAQRRHPGAVIATNGNPSGAVRLLLSQLLESGARLRYHGDFDAAGLAICARMHTIGLEPWCMDTSSYRAALTEADVAGVELPVDPSAAPPTPWDPALRDAFDEHRLIVHEERLLHVLLSG